MRRVIFFLCLCECSAKRDIFTADIYYYLMTEFGYAKCDLHLAEYDGVVLQRFEFIKFIWGKTVIFDSFLR